MSFADRPRTPGSGTDEPPRIERAREPIGDRVNLDDPAYADPDMAGTDADRDLGYDPVVDDMAHHEPDRDPLYDPAHAPTLADPREHAEGLRAAAVRGRVAEDRPGRLDLDREHHGRDRHHDGPDLGEVEDRLNTPSGRTKMLIAIALLSAVNLILALVTVVAVMSADHGDPVVVDGVPCLVEEGIDGGQDVLYCQR